eukprot:CAMPEP_0185729038 /NCGR_PEP_ID=MMETSP1171-20130828/4433_1 /TAXON_ID=374046 /ORGANISM="Helicotheca tamensis, Strain CCMP826" /LENGTH=134 /DNA_ID=CAMNT_0028397803 /DNA_START=124 /DNA_END=528 /DNA_ORIENTATION=-
MKRCPNAPKKKKRSSVSLTSSSSSPFEGYSSSSLLQQAQTAFVDSPLVVPCSNNNDLPSQNSPVIKPARLFSDDSCNSPPTLRRETSHLNNNNIQLTYTRGGENSLPGIQANENAFLRRQHSTGGDLQRLTKRA